MPNVASVLKEEITRLARKEVKLQTESMRKTSVAYRKEIAVLKRRVSVLERDVKKYKKPGTQTPRSVETQTDALRFSPKGLLSNRKRLALSQADFAKLIGVTPASVARWEGGTSRPRKSQLQAIAKVRGLGKREAMKRLGKT